MAQQQTITAIQTRYRGYEFRSRLEAKWAAFFDLCEWPWSYEPEDYNGWIPDFTLGEMRTLVEVKPFYELVEWDETKIKIANSGCERDVILLGLDPCYLTQLWHSDPVIGFLLSRMPECLGGIFETELLHFGYTVGNKKLGLCPNEGSWKNRIWRVPENPTGFEKRRSLWSRVDLNEHDIESVLVARWAEACNISRWMPR